MTGGWSDDEVFDAGVEAAGAEIGMNRDLILENERLRERLRKGRKFVEIMQANRELYFPLDSENALELRRWLEESDL